jgi:hypothetical protein
MTSKNASSSRKGKAVEQLVAAKCVLATGGELNAFTALVDDEGVDLAFKRRNGTRVLDVQVKARFSDADGSAILRTRGRFSSDVRKQTFMARPDLHILYLAVDGPRAEIDWAWLIPSEELDTWAMTVTKRGQPHLRMTASAKAETQDQWSRCRSTGATFPARVLEVVKSLEA